MEETTIITKQNAKTDNDVVAERKKGRERVLDLLKLFLEMMEESFQTSRVTDAARKDIVLTIVRRIVAHRMRKLEKTRSQMTKRPPQKVEKLDPPGVDPMPIQEGAGKAPTAL